MARFTLPRDLYHGPHALEALKTLPGKRAMICVGGGSMKRFGFLDRAEAYLKEAGMEVELFEGIEPDPSVETVMKGAAAMDKFQPDWIVAIGGGSPIDCAARPTSAPSPPPPVRPPRSRPSRSSPITRRASSTPLPTLRSRPMSPSLTPSWPTRCPRSSSPTPAWTR